MTTIQPPSARPEGPRPEAASSTGMAAGLAAFLLWGIVNPFYFKAVAFVDPFEVLAHRVLWSVVLAALLVVCTVGIGGAAREVGTWRRLGILAVSATLITVNWTLFIWAVQQGRLIETSLGYYINPLINVLLGVLLLGERLNGRQTAAVLLAALGVLALLVAHGTLPWVSLTLALTFSIYSLVRKTAPVAPIVGLLVETALLLPLALLYLLYLGPQGAFAAGDLGTDLLLAASGPMTAIPLMLFVVAAQRLRLSTVGLLQYIGPTGQLLMGTLLYGEHFTMAHAVAFSLIWIGLAVFSAEAWSAHRTGVRRAARGTT